MTFLARLCRVAGRLAAESLRPTTEPPRVTWTSHSSPRQSSSGVMAVCRNCGDDGEKSSVLTLTFKPLRRARQYWTLLRCPACSCLFYAQPPATDYGNDEMLSRGRAQLYLQQGAGLAQLIRPVARLPHASGARYLDIGCGFGFGLDFVQTVRGWRGLGIDPGQIAALGRHLLGVPIEQRLLGDDEPDKLHAYDIVMAAETIEHVPSPAAFLQTLRRTLRPGGILVVTTPDGGLVRPETSAGQLVGILSPELHNILQTRDSLAGLLRQAGFGEVVIERDGGSLVAYASDAPFSLNTDEAAFRVTLRGYLETRSTAFTGNDDLFFGFAGRGLLEAANDGDVASGERLRDRLRRAIIGRFTLDIDDISVLPPEVHRCSLARMAELMPLNMASILYGSAMLALARGAPRSQQKHILDCAAAAAATLRRATGELAMEDALSEDLAWAASSEALLCAAETGDAEIPARLQSLRDAARGLPSPRVDVIAARCFVTLVNAGHHSLAKDMVPADAALPDALTRDFDFCRGILELQPDGDPARALQAFQAVRKGLEGTPPNGLYWSALRGEVQALLTLGKEGCVGRLCAEAMARDEGTAAIPADLLGRAQAYLGQDDA